MLDSFKINQLIDIEVEKGADFSGIYRTRVEDIKENSMVIAMPMDKGNYVPLRPGGEVIIWYWDNSASYAYYCKVMERFIEPIPIISLEWPPFKTKKIQRRGYVRVPVNLPLEYQYQLAKEEEDFRKVIIRDLSGGGAQFITKDKLIKGDILKIRLFLPSITVKCKAKVMWAYPEVRNGIEHFLIGIKFFDITEKIQDQIIQYIFLRQRELIQKGVL